MSTDGEPCFGAFQAEGRCLDCAAALWCQDFTLRLDEEAMMREEGQSWYMDALEDLIECVEGGTHGKDEGLLDQSA